MGYALPRPPEDHVRRDACLWLRENGLDGIAAQERYRALLVLENLPAISAWRDGLDETKRGRLNHPGAIWHAWRRATKAESQNVVLKATATKSHKGYGKAIYWPQDALQRAAAAIRDARSTDTLILARRALEAAIRNEMDLLALLPPVPMAVAMSALPRGADISGAEC